MLEKELEKIGLNEKESRVYLVLLRLGPTTALALSRATEIKRPTVYTRLLPKAPSVK